MLICLLLASVTLALYWPATGFDFTNYDDPDYIIYNPAIQHGVSPDSVAWAFKTSHASNWNPVTWISHMVDYSLYGLKPGGHHLTNLIFHTANAVLLFLVLWQLTGTQWRSALVAALFAWHPLHVESVAWISERKDVLSTFFWLLTMMAYGVYGRARLCRALDRSNHGSKFAQYREAPLAVPESRPTESKSRVRPSPGMLCYFLALFF